MDEVDLWLAAAGISLDKAVPVRKSASTSSTTKFGKRQGLGHSGNAKGKTADASAVSQVVQGSEALQQAAQRGKRRHNEVETAAAVAAAAAGAGDEEDSRSAIFTGSHRPGSSVKAPGGKKARRA